MNISKLPWKIDDYFGIGLLDANGNDVLVGTMPDNYKYIVNSVNALKVYVMVRQDDWKYDEPIEQTIVAKTRERAIELASKNPGVWDIEKEVDLSVEQVLTIDKNDG